MKHQITSSVWPAVALLLCMPLAGCNDPKSAPDSSAAERPVLSAGDDVDVAIVTVIAAEYKAMLSHMDRTYPANAGPGETNSFAWVGAEIDRPGGQKPLRLVIALAGEAGTTSGALAVLQTAQTWKPDVLLLAGIAGGIDPRVNRGDVVISEAVWGYEYGAIGAEFASRHDWTFRSNPQLVKSAVSYEGNWQKDIVEEKPQPNVEPRHFAGVTASGNKVFETLDSSFADVVMATFPGIASVEMEGGGGLAAAELLSLNPGAPAVIMLRGISDIPNPRSGMLGDKKDRELWKRYASDAVAAFTKAYLRDALPSGNERGNEFLPETDVLMLTYSDQTFQAIGKELGADLRASANATTKAMVTDNRAGQAYSVAIAYLDDRADPEQVRRSLDRWNPRSVLLVDTALGTSSMKLGDVAIARMVWPFEIDNTVAAQHKDAIRNSRALLVAGQSVLGNWQPADVKSNILKFGAVASGTIIPAWSDRQATQAILAANPRTIAIDAESALFAMVMTEQHSSRPTPTFLSIQGIRQITGSPDTNEQLAATNAAAASVHLLRWVWPMPPIGD